MLPLGNQMMRSLGQALPLIIMRQEPTEFLDHGVDITEVDDSLSFLTEKLIGRRG